MAVEMKASMDGELSASAAPNYDLIFKVLLVGDSGLFAFICADLSV
jgi:hypothetical protein